MTHLEPEEIVTVTPEFTVIGPALEALYPEAIVYEVATVLLFTVNPLFEIIACDCNSPVLGLYSRLALLVYTVVAVPEVALEKSA